MVLQPDLSCWTMSGVLVQNQDWPPAEEIRLDLTTVSIRKMWLSTALVVVHQHLRLVTLIQHILILQVGILNAIYITLMWGIPNTEQYWMSLIEALLNAGAKYIANHWINTRWVAALASSCLDLSLPFHLLALLQGSWLPLVVLHCTSAILVCYQDMKHNFFICARQGGVELWLYSWLLVRTVAVFTCCCVELWLESWLLNEGGWWLYLHVLYHIAPTSTR